MQKFLTFNSIKTLCQQSGIQNIDANTLDVFTQIYAQITFTILFYSTRNLPENQRISPQLIFDSLTFLQESNNVLPQLLRKCTNNTVQTNCIVVSKSRFSQLTKTLLQSINDDIRIHKLARNILHLNVERIFRKFVGTLLYTLKNSDPVPVISENTVKKAFFVFKQYRKIKNLPQNLHLHYYPPKSPPRSKSPRQSNDDTIQLTEENEDTQSQIIATQTTEDTQSQATEDTQSQTQSTQPTEDTQSQTESQPTEDTQSQTESQPTEDTESQTDSEDLPTTQSINEFLQSIDELRQQRDQLLSKELQTRFERDQYKSKLESCDEELQVKDIMLNNILSDKNNLSSSNQQLQIENDSIRKMYELCKEELDKQIDTITEATQTESTDNSDDGTQTESTDNSDNGTQTDSSDNSEDGTQTESPESTHDGTQTEFTESTHDSTQTESTDNSEDGTQTESTDNSEDGTQTDSSDNSDNGTQTESTDNSEDEGFEEPPQPQLPPQLPPPPQPISRDKRRLALPVRYLGGLDDSSDEVKAIKNNLRRRM